MRAVAAIPAAGLLAGAALGVLHPGLPIPPLLAWLAAGALLALFAWRTSRPRLLGAAVLAGFAAGGTLLSSRELADARSTTLRAAFDGLARAERRQAERDGRVLPLDDSAFAIVSGTLKADAATLRSGVSLALDADSIRGSAGATPIAVEGGITATVTGTLAAERLGAWRAGRRVAMPMQLRRPSRYLDPGVSDSEDALLRRGTVLVGTVKSGALVDVLARASWVEEWVSAARGRSRAILRVAVGRWSERSAAIVAAIVIGDRVGLDPDVQRHLQEAGTYHVIAISGGNIAILAGLLLGAFRVAGLLGRTAMVGAMLLLIAYADFVGGGASVDRATLMAVVYFGGRALDQRGSALNPLAGVAGVLVAMSPLTVVEPAFVLTCGATLAILVIVPVATSRPAPRWLRPALSMFAASAAAEALLFPIGALVFSRVTFAGLALNFLAIPLMGVAQIAGMAVVPVGLVSARAAAAVGWIAHLGAAGLVQSAELVRFAPGVTYRVAPPATVAVVSYYAGATIWWVLWRLRREQSGADEGTKARWTRRAASATALVAAAWILAEPWRIAVARGDGRLHVTAIDVGQGDATLITFPHGGTMLVDAGGLSPTSGFDVGDRVVAPVLRAAGVGRLDTLVVTHGDPDHMGGALSIVREFRPRETWEGVPVPAFQPLRDLRAASDALGARWITVKAGDRVTREGVDVLVHHPPPPDWERQRVRNDDSVVVEIAKGSVSILLMGDVGTAVERPIAAAVDAPLRIVKAAHHGSRTSSGPEFVAGLAPQLVVVSAGRANRFGHPDREVVSRYEDAGATVLRTDRDGAITIDTDGTTVRATTYTGRKITLSAMPPRRHDGTKDRAPKGRHEGTRRNRPGEAEESRRCYVFSLVLMMMWRPWCTGRSAVAWRCTADLAQVCWSQSIRAPFGSN